MHMLLSYQVVNGIISTIGKQLKSMDTYVIHTRQINSVLFQSKKQELCSFPGFPHVKTSDLY